MEWLDDDLVALWTLVGEDWPPMGKRPARPELVGLGHRLRVPLEEVRLAGSRSAVWAPQGGEGQKQALEFSTLPGVENVALAPSQGHEWPRRA